MARRSTFVRIDYWLATVLLLFAETDAELALRFPPRFRPVYELARAKRRGYLQFDEPRETPSAGRAEHSHPPFWPRHALATCVRSCQKIALTFVAAILQRGPGAQLGVAASCPATVV